MMSTASKPTSLASPRPLAERSDGSSAEVASRLAASGYPQLRAIQCEVSVGVAVLSGIVSSFYLKQVAQTLVGRSKGVTRVENRLEVRAEN